MPRPRVPAGTLLTAAVLLAMIAHWFHSHGRHDAAQFHIQVLYACGRFAALQGVQCCGIVVCDLMPSDQVLHLKVNSVRHTSSFEMCAAFLRNAMLSCLRPCNTNNLKDLAQEINRTARSDSCHRCLRVQTHACAHEQAGFGWAWSWGQHVRRGILVLSSPATRAKRYYLSAVDGSTVSQKDDEHGDR